MCILTPSPQCVLLQMNTNIAAVDDECGVPKQNCEPVSGPNNCKGCDADKYTNIPNPFDCVSYYVCHGDGVLGFPFAFPCPDGEHFNINTSECSAEVKCNLVCNRPGSGSCLYSCGGSASDTHLADPYDCRIYYKCTNNIIGPAQTCSTSNPYFDGSSCQSDESKCCHCQPYCYSWDIDHMIADPKDCRKYYACMEEGPPNPQFSGECTNENFDPHSQTCSETAPCITPCKNVVDDTGCIDPFTCEAKGEFAKCPSNCTREYYNCAEITGDYIESELCPVGFDFHPDDHVCVISYTCPYNLR